MKTLGFILSAMLVLLLALEGTARILKLGKGKVADFDFKKGYFAFYPHQKLALHSARINQAGLRGEDFSLKKPEGTFRVLCLGGSSTFGFGNKDNETYPFYLRNQLQKIFDKPVEVINAGIPYANTSNLYALFKKRLLALNPDAIVLYTGYNDASDAVHQSHFISWLYLKLFKYSEFFVWFQSKIKAWIKKNRKTKSFYPILYRPYYYVSY